MMRRLAFLITASLLATGVVRAQCRSYATGFDTAETPLSEAGAWTQGAVDGTSWTNVNASTSRACGTHPGVNYDDSVAHLSGFGADQQIEGTIYRTGSFSTTQEIELLLRFKITPGTARGYEVLIDQSGSGQIIRWNGPLGNFTALASITTGSVADGDVFRGQIVGSTIEVYKNGAKLTTTPSVVTDSTWADGQPGIGFFTRDLTRTQNQQLCWKDVSAKNIPECAPTPSYISSMSPYQSRRMCTTGQTGCPAGHTFAPTNGTTSMQSVTPSAWQTNDPGTNDLTTVIAHWTGGSGGGSQLYVHGGGHNGGANNGIYVFDFWGTSAPVGWQTPLVVSAVSAVSVGVGQDQYSDGRPTSIHTYDLMWYAEHSGLVYRTGGARYADGYATHGTWSFNPSTRQWKRLADNPDGAGWTALYSSAHRKTFVMYHATGRFYNLATNTWSVQKSIPAGAGQVEHSSTSAWDTNRNRAIVIGMGRTKLLTIDWTAETLSESTFTPTGTYDTMFSQRGTMVFYDALRDSYWMLGGPTGSLGWSNIYEMNAQTFAVSKTPLTGDVPIEQLTSEPAWGAYDRFVYMPQWRAIGTIADVDTGPYVIALPSGSTGTVPPSTPTGVNAF